MSGRFVSGGTIGASGEASSQDAAAAPPPPNEKKGNEGAGTKNKEWEAVQQELEADRKRREEQRAKAAAGQEPSLYDILQANKAAKQAAFEEQNKIRNQFRALDDDEIDFLDEVRESKRREEEAARREVEEGLKAFRAQQRTGEAAGDGGRAENKEEEGEEESWGVGRKRKRVKDRERDLKGLMKRKVNGAGEAEKKKDDEERHDVPDKADTSKSTSPKTTETQKGDAPAKKTALGLVDYGSDDESD